MTMDDHLFYMFRHICLEDEGEKEQGNCKEKIKIRNGAKCLNVVVG